MPVAFVKTQESNDQNAPYIATGFTVNKWYPAAITQWKKNAEDAYTSGTAVIYGYFLRSFH